MEQVISLINKLEQQIRQGAAINELLATTAFMKSELQASSCEKFTQQESVAVWLPAGYKAVPQSQPPAAITRQHETPVIVASREPAMSVTVETPEPVIPVIASTPAPVQVSIPEPVAPAILEEPLISEQAKPVSRPEPLFVPLPPRAPLVPQVISEATTESITTSYEDIRPSDGPVIFHLDVEIDEAEEAEAALEIVEAKQPELPKVPEAPVVMAEPEPVAEDKPVTKPFPQYPDVATLMKNIFPSAPAEKTITREVNEVLDVDRVTALNQRLYERKTEVADVLVKGSRISDIRKAISVNEKYQMINSLFRGDEDMFERSVRTLNNFGTLPEARFWMQRELILKLGWNESDELVQHFQGLVSRRFS